MSFPPLRVMRSGDMAGLLCVDEVMLDLPPHPFAVVGHLPCGVFFQLQHELDVIVVVAGGNMEMDVENGLACGLPVIGKNVESLGFEQIHDRLRDDFGRQDEVVEFLLRHIEECFAVRPRDDQNMAEMNRVYVEDRNGMPVCVEGLGR